MDIQEMNHRKKDLLSAGMMFSALGILIWLLLSTYMEAAPNIKRTLQSLWFGLFIVLLFNEVGFLSLHLCTWFANLYLLNAQKKWKIALMYLALMSMFLFITYITLVIAKLLSGTPQPFLFPHGGIRLLIVIWLVEMIVLGLILANRATAQMLHYQQQATKLQKENMTAQYAALQEQLNPHFLFNSFNTLVAEIEYDPQQAVVFTRRLSDVYRYVLQVHKQRLVTLNEEMTFASAYLFVHKVRLGNCIHYDMNIPREIQEYRLPPLTLQVLLENIIKHNSISETQPMQIKFAATEEWLSVSNSLSPRTSTESTKIGLSNLSNRCRMILGRDIQIIRTNQCFIVKIPLLYE